MQHPHFGDQRTRASGFPPIVGGEISIFRDSACAASRDSIVSNYFRARRRFNFKQPNLSSSGLTGRSSTPRPLDSIISVSGILDPRFPGDDDIVRKHTFAFSRRHAPEVCENFSPLKTEGVGNAGRSMHPQPRV
jgi:hypothetical protein